MKRIITKKRLFFRADANSRMGLGHVSRLLALAEMTKDDFTCHFIASGTSPSVARQILAVCERIIKIACYAPIESEAQYLIQHILQSGDLLVIDGYQFTEQYQKVLSSAGIKLICLDDLHQLYFHADAVINPAGGVEPEDYRGEIYTWYRLGPAFAPMRAPFRKALFQRKKEVEKVEKIFICFGGSDLSNLTAKAVSAVCPLPWIKELHIVVGSAYQHLPSIQQMAAKQTDKILIYQNLDAEEMVQVMQKCQLAIAPASTIAYEIGMVGLGLITGVSADNQKGMAHFLALSQCATCIGDFQQITIQKLRTEVAKYHLTTLHHHLFQQSLIFSDNTSSLLKIFQRIALENDISIRKAKLSDLMIYFNWINEVETRKQAIHSEAIDLESHTRWFKKKVSSDTDFLFIFELEKQPVGQVRFDKDHEKYVISFSVDPKFRGKGLGTLIMKMALKSLQKELHFRPQVKAFVKPANTSSLYVFKQNSFFFKERMKINDVLLEVFEK